jgi:16S rRNA (guanine966-N2)-methyltransferase
VLAHLVRIVAGTHRGRLLAPPPDDRIRPTSDRVREALFNSLRHRLGGFAGKRVLDGFAGTGALGLEALSQGADRALFLDNDRAAVALARRNAQTLGLGDRAAFRLLDATRPGAADDRYDLILLDPPYGAGLAAAALSALAAAGWLAADALIAIEADKAQPERIPEGFATLIARDYGRTRITLAQPAT